MAQHEVTAEESGFRATWAGTDLDEYRSSRGTYEMYPPETLPPLPEDRFTGSFDWLREPGEPVPAHVARIDQIAASLAEDGLELPADFVALMTREHLHGSLDEVSCTCCWTYLAGPFTSPVDPTARLVMFFRDQQDCVIWYLYLRPRGDEGGTESFVALSYRQFEYEEELRAAATEESLSELKALSEDPYGEIFWCAASVEQFAYRFWIEGKLWFTLSGDADMADATDDMRAYLAFYGQQAAPAE